VLYAHAKVRFPRICWGNFNPIETAGDAEKEGRSLKIGLIGYGYWGTNLFRNLANNNHFQLVAVADHSETRRISLRRILNGGRVLASADDLIRDNEIEAVFIATPAATHFLLARQAILAGKHVFVEKPLSTTVAEAEELVSLAERNGVILMVDHTYLFTGAVQRIAEAIQSGELGRLCYYDSTRINLGLFQPDINVLWDLAPHDLSILDHLLDEEPIRIAASGYCHINHHLPDIAYLTLRYASDVVAHLNLSWMSPVKVRRVAIGGTRKMMVWDDLNREERVKIFDCGIQYHPEDQRSVIIPDYRIGDIYSPRVPNREALAGVVEHFAQVVAGARSSIMDGRRGLRIVRILESAQKIFNEELHEVSNLLTRS
jgi:predicted dehydrogenase